MFSRKILIIDDEKKLRNLLSRIIRLEGYEVVESDGCTDAVAKLKSQKFDLIVCDVKLVDGSGIELTQTIKQLYPQIEIILLTAYGNIADGVQAIKNGAFDYLIKGDDNNKILPLIARAFEKINLGKKQANTSLPIEKENGFDDIIGKSVVFQQTIALSKKVAPTSASVLLTGETGTGKEVFAQAIHLASPRCKQSFVAINCAAFSKELLESEFFGYKAGAFTGALKEKKGLFEEADKGTLFLDEIGEMELGLQAKLLRIIETGELIKLGDTKPLKIDVRIIAATNRNLFFEINEGRFRSDLFYRLSTFEIRLPALKERVEDIPLLVKYYVDRFSQQLNIKINHISKSFMESLSGHEWKGNIRELKNVIERSMILLNDGDDILDLHTLPSDFNLPQDQHVPNKLSATEKDHIQNMLKRTQGNKVEAARLLQIGLTTLYRKIQKYNLD